MGKIDAQGKLVKMIDQYQNLVLSICYRMTNDYFAAQDLTQETFLSIYQHMDSFQGGNEKAWICRIASNKAIDYMKQAGNKVFYMEDTQMEEKESPEGIPEHRVLEKEVRHQLKTTCQTLKEPYGQIAMLYFYEEKKPEEIARQTQRNLKTVQTQIYRAREMLRTIYRKEG